MSFKHFQSEIDGYCDQNNGNESGREKLVNAAFYQNIVLHTEICFLRHLLTFIFLQIANGSATSSISSTTSPSSTHTPSHSPKARDKNNINNNNESDSKTIKKKHKHKKTSSSNGCQRALEQMTNNSISEEKHKAVQDKLELLERKFDLLVQVRHACQTD